MNATTIAERWKRNRAIIEDWMSDYAKRSGTSRADIIAERQANWHHDERAKIAAVIDGYKLSACPHNGLWRYTVVTPWGMNEGLCDLDNRDDRTAAIFLHQVIDNI